MILKMIAVVVAYLILMLGAWFTIKGINDIEQDG